MAESRTTGRLEKKRRGLNVRDSVTKQIGMVVGTGELGREGKVGGKSRSAGVEVTAHICLPRKFFVDELCDPQYK